MESRVSMCSGSEFQSLGAEQLKAQAPSEVSEKEGGGKQGRQMRNGVGYKGEAN